MIDDRLAQAMMLLEIGMDELNPEYGDQQDYMMFAYSYIGAVYFNVEVPKDSLEMVARIKSDVAIGDAKR